MTIRRTLNVSKSFLTTDGFGNGTIVLGPTFYADTWYVSNIAVRAENVGGTNVDLVTRLYTGTPTAGNLLASTYDGIGDSTDVDVTLHAGQILTAVWTTEPPVLCGFPILTLSLYGQQEIQQ